MALNTTERLGTEMFIGEEVEHTPMFGKKTLFVVGILPIEKITTMAANHNIDHIYLGTSQSFAPISDHDYKEWPEYIESLLEYGFFITLDFDIADAAAISEFQFINNPKFIPMISVKLPNIDSFNDNATLKLDDTTWGYSNKGVWTHNLKTLQADEIFTPWDKYINDTEVDSE